MGFNRADTKTAKYSMIQMEKESIQRMTVYNTHSDIRLLITQNNTILSQCLTEAD